MKLSQETNLLKLKHIFENMFEKIIYLFDDFLLPKTAQYS